MLSTTATTQAAPAPQRIVVVIPCLNEAGHIRTLVEELIAHNSGLDLTVVIADGGSTDGTPDIAKELASNHPHVHYLHNPKRIQSAAVNLAIRQYPGDVLIRLDAHAAYPADFCRILLAEQTASGADSIVVPMNTLGQSGFQRAVAAAQNSLLGNGGSAHRNANSDGKWVDHGHHALMRVEAFNAVSGYDETFSHNEDAELDLRLTAAGYKIWLTGKTSLDYFPRKTAGALFKQYLRFGRGRARTVLKHNIIPKLRQMVPAAVFPALVLALASPWLAVAALPLLAWAGLCLAYGSYIAFKAGDATLALSGPAAMVMHMGWSIGFWHALLKGLWERRA